MKKIIITLSIILIAFISQAQTYPVQQNLGSATTLVKNPNYGGTQGGLIPFTFVDTTSANTNATYLKNYAGAIIYCSGPDALFWRDISIGAWIQVLPAGGGGTGLLAWVQGGNSPVVTDGSGFGLLGPKTNNGWSAITNNIVRLSINTSGAYGIGSARDFGTSGYVLTSQGSGAAPIWAASGGGSVPISSLTAAVADNAINNVNFSQIWNWNSFTADGINGLALLANTTATVDGGDGLFAVAVSGANSASGVTSKAVNFTNSHSGTTSTNIAGYFSAVNGSNNYAIIVPASEGRVGIGNASPTSLLTLGTNGSVSGNFAINGSTSGTISLIPQAAAGTYNWNFPTTAGTSGQFLTSAGGIGSPMTWTTPTTGTVTAVSVASANGFAGSSTGGATPALTMSTSINSPILAGNGTALIAATTTGSGSTAVLNTSPSFVTSVIGDATFSAFNTITTSLSLGGAATTLNIGGTPTTAITHNYSTNATATATTKTINFGTGGASGSTTAINIGSATSGAVASIKLNLAPASDANWDLYTRNSSGFLERIGNGSTGQFLGANTNAKPTWQTPSSFALTNGSGTTANGTAVDWGGVALAPISVDMSTFDLTLMDGALTFLTYVASTNVTTIGEGNSSISLDAVNRITTINGSLGTVLTSGVIQFSAFGAGAATFSSDGTISSVSDKRLKIIEGNYTKGLLQLKNIVPVYYKYNEIFDKLYRGGKSPDTTTYIGFIAQNFQKEFGNESVGHDKSGYLSLNDRAVTGALVNGVNEQQKQIEALTKRVMYLEKKINSKK